MDAHESMNKNILCFAIDLSPWKLPFGVGDAIFPIESHSFRARNLLNNSLALLRPMRLNFLIAFLISIFTQPHINAFSMRIWTTSFTTQNKLKKLLWVTQQFRFICYLEEHYSKYLTNWMENYWKTLILHGWNPIFLEEICKNYDYALVIYDVSRRKQKKIVDVFNRQWWHLWFLLGTEVGNFFRTH